MRTISEDKEVCVKIMCDLLKVTEKELLTSRAGILPFARYIIIQYLQTLGYNKSEIGKAIDKDHSSVINCLKRLEGALETPGYNDIRTLRKKFLKEIDALKERLKALGLTRCVWEVPIKGRLCQYCKLQNCVDRKL